jgi:hypothetical protein
VKLSLNTALMRVPNPFGLMGLAAVVIALLVAISFFSHAGAAFYDPSVALAHFGGVVLLVILPLWLVLRISDFIFGGPARRRVRKEAE